MTALEPLTLGIVFALAQAAHCAGMCGIFALKAAAGASPLRKVSLYGAGKTITYLFLGSVAGWAGDRLAGVAAPAQIVLGALTGIVLVVAAVHRLRGAPRPSRAGTWLAGQLAPWLRGIDRDGGPLSRLFLGVLTGALPCGVVYLAALQGAALGSALAGVLVMAGLGLGTGLVLAVVGLGGHGVLARCGARRVRVVGGVLLLAAGLVALARIVLPLLATPNGSNLPCCH